MLEKLSKNIAIKIKEADPDGPVSIEVMEYALGIKMNFYATILLTVIIGVVTGYIWQNLLALTGVAVSRRFSGGYHFNSLTVCTIVTAIAASIIPTITLKGESFWVIAVMTFLIFLIYAPNSFVADHSTNGKEKHKLICLVVVLIAAIIKSDILLLSCLLQAVTVLPWKGGARKWRKV